MLFTLAEYWVWILRKTLCILPDRRRGNFLTAASVSRTALEGAIWDNFPFGSTTS